MSVFGALNTAVSGLSAQAHAFTDISNNIANSQTVGFKSTTTDFSDYVLSSAATQGTSETVLATTAASNESQGTITASSNALALAISGRGFFNVSENSGDSSSTSTSFKTTDYYTRDGDFSEDNQGYLVNSSNEYLKAYAVDSTGAVDTTQLAPINVQNVTFRPTATSTITYNADLPGNVAAAAPGATTAATTQSQTIYDSTGAQHIAAFNWTPTGSNTWTVSASVDGSTTPASSAVVTFGSDGTISSIAQQTNPGSNPAAYGAPMSTTGSPATFSIPTNLGGSPQTISVNLGSIGAASGTTMSTNASSTGSAATIQSDSVTTGNYTGVAMTSDGNIMATFDNDHTQLIGKVPLAMFANSNALTALDGQAYTATASSGAATETLSGQNGAGDLETSSVENSTTSLDTDLTRLITAQQAYGANAKVVTTANDMLQTVLAMKQ
jgi:flagellar hook protein FlgE